MVIDIGVGDSRLGLQVLAYKVIMVGALQSVVDSPAVFAFHAL